MRIINSKLSTDFVDVDSAQDILGKKTFKDGLVIGDDVQDYGNNCFGVGSELSIGSYNFFYKGIDLDTTNKTAKIYLCKEQPAYPYPFCIQNGDKTKFKLESRWGDTTSQVATISALSGNGDDSKIWNGTVDSLKPDYNKLCADLGPNFRDNQAGILSCVKEYINDAFTSDKDELSTYDLTTNAKVGDVLTMVNNVKIEYLRCATITGIKDDGVLCVKLNDASFNHLSDKGIEMNDFDYDDASLVFIDKPGMIGPATTTTYGSLAIGADNLCLRRCSFTSGKNNVAESDFCVALGRKATADKYCSFVWAPAQTIKAADSSTFTIGVKDSLTSAHKEKNKRTLKFGDTNNNFEDVHEYVWGCISSENNGKPGKIFNEMKTAFTSGVNDTLQTNLNNLSNKVTTLSAKTVDNVSDQVIGGNKTFTNTFAVGTNVNGKGNACMGIGQSLSVGQNNFFYKGIEYDTTTNKLSIYLCPEQPRFPYPFYRTTTEISAGTFKIGGIDVKPNDPTTWAALSGGPYTGNPPTLTSNGTLNSNLKNTKTPMLCATWLCQFEKSGANWNLGEYNKRNTKLYRPVRNDYNQLSIDVPGYIADIQTGGIASNKVEQVKTKLSEYYLSAFKPEASNAALTACLNGKLAQLSGKQFTPINDWKIEFMRCGTIENILSNSVLVVNLDKEDARRVLKESGILFSDFDYDEASIRFVDNPELSGPASDVTNASLAVGSLNQVFGRDSLVVGKECYAEGDHSVALGRRAKANDYVSFVWSPDTTPGVASSGNNTFTVGVTGNLSNAYSNKDARSLRIADRNGDSVDIATFIVNCISKDSNLKNALKTALGI